jgi:two-component system phosphate regulon response regulator PhoB/two-component system alkaline phosphatase synthesis response regulator PhoP
MKKILIAEDDKFLANAYRVKLEKEGFETTIASNGEEVFQILESGKPDLIILDLIMPKKDGFSTLEDINKSDKYNDIPVLIASNLGQKEDIDRGMALGAKGYIIKSDMSMEGLVKQISDILSGKSVEPSKSMDLPGASDLNNKSQVESIA